MAIYPVRFQNACFGDTSMSVAKVLRELVQCMKPMYKGSHFRVEE